MTNSPDLDPTNDGGAALTGPGTAAPIDPAAGPGPLPADPVPSAADPGGCAVARRITASWRTAGRDDVGYGRVRILPCLRRMTLTAGKSVAN